MNRITAVTELAGFVPEVEKLEISFVLMLSKKNCGLLPGQLQTQCV